MKNLKEIISEKLVFNKHTKMKSEFDYWYGDIDEQGDMKDEFYDNRKLKRKTNENGELKNRPWFAVYLYLKENGPHTRAEIVKALWNKEFNSGMGRFFANMVHCGIIYSNNGKTTLCDLHNWTSRYKYKFEELIK